VAAVGGETVAEDGEVVAGGGLPAALGGLQADDLVNFRRMIIPGTLPMNASRLVQSCPEASVFWIRQVRQGQVMGNKRDTWDGLRTLVAAEFYQQWGLH